MSEENQQVTIPVRNLEDLYWLIRNRGGQGELREDVVIVVHTGPQHLLVEGQRQVRDAPATSSMVVYTNDGQEHRFPSLVLEPLPAWTAAVQLHPTERPRSPAAEASWLAKT